MGRETGGLYGREYGVASAFTRRAGGDVAFDDERCGQLSSSSRAMCVKLWHVGSVNSILAEAASVRPWAASRWMDELERASFEAPSPLWGISIYTSPSPDSGRLSVISSAVRRADSKRTNPPLGFPWLRLRSANGTQGLAVPTITVMAVSQRLRTRASGPLAGGTPTLPT